MIEVKMIIDSNGNMLTDTEIKRMSVKDLSVNVNDSEDLMEHLDSLVEKLEGSEEFRLLNARFSYYMEEIRKYLPEDKKYLPMKLDDCFTEELILYQEFFYKRGYNDSQRCGNGKLKRSLSRSL